MEHLLYIYDFDYMTVSFGFSDTLLTTSASSISSELDELSLVAAGGSLGLVRLSVGYTGHIDHRFVQVERGYAVATSV